MEKQETPTMTWSPPTELFDELRKEVRSCKSIKYFSWGYEGVKFIVKDDATGEKTTHSVFNEDDPKETLKKSIEKIRSLRELVLEGSSDPHTGGVLRNSLKKHE